MNETCTLTITHEGTTWENCCPDSTPETASSACPPILRTWPKCPTPYTNCADPSSHKEMCSAELTGYTDSRSLNRKCCPAGYTCGSSYNTPCILLKHNTTREGGAHVHTNPQYISTPAVFAGCNDASALSPAAVGGIVAVGVISFCLLCGALLWWIRRRLYRDPARRRYWRTVERSVVTTTGAGGKGDNFAMGVGGTGITITREFKVEERDGDAGRRSVDSTTRIIPGGSAAGGGDEGGGGMESPPSEGTLLATQGRERSEV